MVDFLKSLSDGLRKHRKIHGKTQEQIAGYLDMDTKSYQAVENHRRGLSLSKMVMLCELYGITLNDLLDLSDLENKEATRLLLIGELKQGLDKLSYEQVCQMKILFEGMIE